MAEVDFSWVGLDEPWERLRWARLRKYDSAAAFARAIGWQSNTYSAYEREPGSSKHSRMKHEEAMTFGRRVKVRWEWLLTGQGEPWLSFEDEDASPRNRILKAIEDADPIELERLAAMVELMTGTGGVRG